uniref:Uncharacterized protein n=1 Tax=Anguilla anguilla TaxID=7936 RepID=A0A0E9Q8I8_ANGAN
MNEERTSNSRLKETAVF